MKQDRDGDRCICPKDHWECMGEPIPEVFPTRMAFLKTVAMGISMTLLIFGIFSLLIIKPWH